ncbi:DUF3011 family protein [Novosphingobium sp. PhB165]|uniref:DUF3011 domain-containing protein n=1 Tax=Novosphingobium sp. PhB165 TaxID=2485105 RepID=UPI001046551E|nr:DUF3011 domain-containing protein [Novosphingobium sp. PhB165]TCM20629.1 DUF3011 family protein [Novosphingobium sp. PhB165]
MRGKVTMIAATAVLAAQPTNTLTAQTRPAEPIQTLPAPVDTSSPSVPGVQRPVPLPAPVPGRPQVRPPSGGGQSGGGQRPVPLPAPAPGRPNGFAGRLTCESRNNRTERCNARTENRVELLTRSSQCVRGQSWGYDQRQIWVSRNCRGTFAYGYGNNHWQDQGNNNNSGGGLSTGAIIGGAAVAAGLVALLNNRNSPRPSGASQGSVPPPPTATPTPAPTQPETPPPPTGPFQPGPPATVVADLSSLPPDARPSMNTCMMEAARQVGITGGTQVRFDRLVHIEPGNGGWRFRAQLTGTYPDGERMLPLFCRATPTRVVELDFRN